MAADQIQMQKQMVAGRENEDPNAGVQLKDIRETMTQTTDKNSKRKRRNKTFESSLLQDFGRTRQNVITEQTLKSQTSL
jgi:hypothetical protein